MSFVWSAKSWRQATTIRRKKEMKVIFTLESQDAGVLEKAATECGLTLNRYIKELAECKAADLRTEEKK